MPLGILFFINAPLPYPRPSFGVLKRETIYLMLLPPLPPLLLFFPTFILVSSLFTTPYSWVLLPSVLPCSSCTQRQNKSIQFDIHQILLSSLEGDLGTRLTSVMQMCTVGEIDMTNPVFEHYSHVVCSPHPECLGLEAMWYVMHISSVIHHT